MTLPKPAFNNFMATPAPKKQISGPKQEPKSLVDLVNPRDKLTHNQIIDYLKRMLDAKKRVG